MSFALHYTLSMPAPHTHMLCVDVEVTGWTSSELRFAMPVWTPGSYLVREYSQHVQDVSACAKSGKTLSTHQVDKRTWSVDADGEDTVVFSYRVYSHDLTVRTNHLDDTHAFVASAATFFSVEGHESESCTLQIEEPEGWETTTSLQKGADGFYQIRDQDHLVDSPIEVGIHEVYPFQVLGKDHSYVVWGESNCDMERLIKDTQAVVEETANHFGGTVPYERYLFLIHSAVGIRGGLEHLDSTVLAWDALKFQPLNLYEDFLRLVAHEYFHTWNVKRLRARVLGPFDYSQETYTKMLWFHEGGTVYYEGLIPMRAGVLRTKSWLDEMGKSVHMLRSQPGRKHMSVGASSFNAWIKLYRRNEHTKNCTISYYLKGEMVCLCLDKMIREQTEGARSMDDVMRLFYERTCPPNPGFLDEEVAPWIEEATGVDVRDFLAKYVDGLEPLPLEETFEWYGLELKGEHDTGAPDDGPGAYLGVDTVAKMGRARVTFVNEEGPAQAAGIYPNDELVAVDGYRISSSELKSRLRLCEAGQEVEISLFRRDRLQAVSVTLGERPFDKYTLTARDNATEAEKKRFEDLLKVSFPVKED